MHSLLLTVVFRDLESKQPVEQPPVDAMTFWCPVCQSTIPAGPPWMNHLSSEEHNHKKLALDQVMFAQDREQPVNKKTHVEKIVEQVPGNNFVSF